jgi:hypothetical protein
MTQLRRATTELMRKALAGQERPVRS